MKQQTDLNKKDLSAVARRQFAGLSARMGRDNVTGGDWYVRLATGTDGVTPLLLLVIPIAIRNGVTGEWRNEEYITVVA